MLFSTIKYRVWTLAPTGDLVLLSRIKYRVWTLAPREWSCVILCRVIKVSSTLGTRSSIFLSLDTNKNGVTYEEREVSSEDL